MFLDWTSGVSTGGRFFSGEDAEREGLALKYQPNALLANGLRYLFGAKPPIPEYPERQYDSVGVPVYLLLSEYNTTFRIINSGMATAGALHTGGKFNPKVQYMTLTSVADLAENDPATGYTKNKVAALLKFLETDDFGDGLSLKEIGRMVMEAIKDTKTTNRLLEVDMAGKNLIHLLEETWTELKKIFRNKKTQSELKKKVYDPIKFNVEAEYARKRLEVQSSRQAQLDADKKAAAEAAADRATENAALQRERLDLQQTKAEKAAELQRNRLDLQKANAEKAAELQRNRLDLQQAKAEKAAELREKQFDFQKRKYEDKEREKAEKRAKKEEEKAQAIVDFWGAQSAAGIERFVKEQLMQARRNQMDDSLKALVIVVRANRLLLITLDSLDGEAEPLFDEAEPLKRLEQLLAPKPWVILMGDFGKYTRDSIDKNERGYGSPTNKIYFFDPAPFRGNETQTFAITYPQRIGVWLGSQTRTMMYNVYSMLMTAQISILGVGSVP